MPKHRRTFATTAKQTITLRVPVYGPNRTLSDGSTGFCRGPLTHYDVIECDVEIQTCAERIFDLAWKAHGTKQKQSVAGPIRVKIVAERVKGSEPRS